MIRRVARSGIHSRASVEIRANQAIAFFCAASGSLDTLHGHSSMLEQGDRAESAVGADADDRAATFRHRRKLLDGLTQDARSRGGEGMPERHAAAVRVHPIARKAAKDLLNPGFLADEVFVLERLDVAEPLRGERLVNFPKRDVVEPQSASCQQPWNGRHGRHEQPLAKDIDRRDLEIDKAYTRSLKGQPWQPLVR